MSTKCKILGSRFILDFINRLPVIFHLGGAKMEQLLPFISEVGFPIVVTLYLLHRIETKLDVMIETMQALPSQIKDEMLIRPPHIN